MFEDFFAPKPVRTGVLLRQRLAIKNELFLFYPSMQHIKNIEMMLTLICDECGIWMIYSKRKLKKERLEEALSFSCGAVLQDADIPYELKDTVYVRDRKIVLLCKIR